MRLFQKHIALPQQHGAWAIWLGPFAIGVGGSDAIQPGLFWLTIASLGGFLSLQPLTILVKVLVSRRSRADLHPALLWVAAYGLLGLVGGLGLLATGNLFVLWLGLVALPVLVWQMLLVARRDERNQMRVELVGAGVLCLAAPAAYWANSGSLNAQGWWLFILCWLQAAGAIVYIYLRLEHRRLTTLSDWSQRLKIGWRSTLYNFANLIIAAGLVAFGVAPGGILIPFSLMCGEAVYGGLLRPGIGANPAAIGLRQVLVTVVFAILMILAYRF